MIQAAVDSTSSDNTQFKDTSEMYRVSKKNDNTLNRNLFFIFQPQLVCI